jgi:Zn-dependent protease/CBS domain-containing protein
VTAGPPLCYDRVNPGSGGKRRTIREEDLVGGFRVGSIFGIDIRIDYSWFIIFFLILWTFGLAVFPSLYPGQETLTYLLMAGSGTLLFFASLLAHELSHSLLARSRGIPVSGITLFIFGGMAHTSMEFRTPKDEFQIAGIGPVSSLAIGGGFYLIALIGRAAGWSVAVTGVAGYLAFINVFLAVFNMLPGFPLDGGRLFRAAVWQYTGDLKKATRFATNGGKVIGYLLMFVGLLNLFSGNPVGGLWLVLIGWFIRSAAEASYVQMLLRRSLEGVRVSDAMTPDPYTVSAGSSLEEFVDEHVFRGKHHAYPVLQDGRAVGIITLDRIKRFPRAEWGRRTVADAMAAVGESSLVRPEERMDQVLDRFGDSETGRVLVTRDGDLVGIITRSDLARWLERLRIQESR